MLLWADVARHSVVISSGYTTAVRRYRLVPILSLFIAVNAWAATVGETDRILPLIQDGGGWSTQVSITNLAAKPATVVAAFLTKRGFAEAWPVSLKSTAGTVKNATAEIPLAPGATAIIETSGTPTTLTRGFAEVAELADQPIGVSATLIQKDGDLIIQTVKIPLAPAHERKSVVPFDLTDPLLKPQMIWVSMTSSTVLDVVFRNLRGETVFTDQINFDGSAQLSLNVRDYWPQLKEFRGTMQWSVTFPFADRYEQRYLSGLSLLIREGQPWTVLNGMTLPADQASISPY